MSEEDINRDLQKHAEWMGSGGVKGARLNWSGKNMTFVDLSGRDMEGGLFKDTNFSRSNLSGANLSHCWLQGAKFVFANLENADLTASDIRGIEFYSALIDGVRLDPETISGPGHILCALTDDEWETVKRGRGQ